MHKLAVASLVSILGLAAPALACPNSDHDEAPATKTADKAKEQPKTPAKEQPKAEPAKDTAKKPAEAKKAGDKVSLK